MHVKNAHFDPNPVISVFLALETMFFPVKGNAVICMDFRSNCPGNFRGKNTTKLVAWKAGPFALFFEPLARSAGPTMGHLRTPRTWRSLQVGASWLRFLDILLRVFLVCTSP